MRQGLGLHRAMGGFGQGRQDLAGGQVASEFAHDCFGLAAADIAHNRHHGIAAGEILLVEAVQVGWGDAADGLLAGAGRIAVGMGGIHLPGVGYRGEEIGLGAVLLEGFHRTVLLAFEHGRIEAGLNQHIAHQAEGRVEDIRLGEAAQTHAGSVGGVVAGKAHGQIAHALEQGFFAQAFGAGIGQAGGEIGHADFVGAVAAAAGIEGYVDIDNWVFMPLHQQHFGALGGLPALNRNILGQRGGGQQAGQQQGAEQGFHGDSLLNWDTVWAALKRVLSGSLKWEPEGYLKHIPPCFR
ncbi:hypothetical protein EIKCOROL_02394 [Eikenella corrodens ATCC 23834]|uniref:Uncharacterized protein n=1 Tax=Eikenella corrodens ATCC 23834 TaxID=546274 RepID=C0DYD0_EIKCO|nr:hypothetical protein EIKCOROL_02394 [Eikenella corrodens ATCC 23834]